MRQSRPSPTSCPQRQNGKRLSSKKRQMSKEKKAIMMKRMKASRSLKVTKNLERMRRTTQRGRTKRTKQMMQQMPQWQATLRRQPRPRQPSRLLEVMRLQMRKRRRKEKKRSKRRRNLNMIVITMRRVATSGVRRTKTGSSTIKRTRMPTKPANRLYRSV